MGTGCQPLIPLDHVQGLLVKYRAGSDFTFPFLGFPVINLAPPHSIFALVRAGNPITYDNYVP